MGEIGLVEAIASLRAELTDAVEKAGNEDIQSRSLRLMLSSRSG